MRNARLWLSIGLAGLIAGSVLFSQTEKTEIDRVSEKVEVLQREVSSLVIQVELLNQDIAQLKARSTFQLPNLPPGTEEREINGLRYYLLPVREDPDNGRH